MIGFRSKGGEVVDGEKLILQQRSALLLQLFGEIAHLVLHFAHCRPAVDSLVVVPGIKSIYQGISID